MVFALWQLQQLNARDKVQIAANQKTVDVIAKIVLQNHKQVQAQCLLFIKLAKTNVTQLVELEKRQSEQWQIDVISARIRAESDYIYSQRECTEDGVVPALTKNFPTVNQPLHH